MPAKKESGSAKVHERRMHLEEKLIENLVELQKVHTSLAEKFDRLAEQIASLLNLFESAAQSFARNPLSKVSEKDQEFLEKIDRLLDQNKTIAKGLTMMEERIREKTNSSKESSEKSEQQMQEGTDEAANIPSITNRPLPRF
jgi:DNA-binding ferritin-like protein